MNKFLFKSFGITLLSLCFFVNATIAQTISTVQFTNSVGAVPAAGFCAGEQLRVTFTPTGFPSNTTFNIQVSDAAGFFTAPLATTTSTSNQASLLLPTTAPAGGGYRVRVSVGAVSGSSGIFAISAAPAAPTVATPVYNYCQGQTPTPLSATATGTNQLRWYASETAIAYTTNPPSISTTGLGQQKYYVAQANAAGCESPRVTITVNVLAAPTSLPNTSITVNRCLNDNTPLTATATGTNTVRWYTTATGGTPSATPPALNTSVPVQQSTQAYVTQANAAGCEFPRAAVTVNVFARPTTAPTVNTTAYNYCVGQTAPATPLTATANGGNTLVWHTTQTGGTGSATALTPSIATAGTTTYYVTQANSNSCEYTPRTPITVTVTSIAAPTVATASYTYCVGQTPTALSATALTGHTTRWYTSATGGTASTTAPAVSTASVGTTNYYVTQVNTTTGCESSPRTPITVNVVSGPNTPPTVATTQFYYCQNQAATVLSATAAAGYTLVWYNAAGTQLSAAPTPSTANVGVQTFTVTQSFGSCEYTPRTTITVNTLAPPTVAPTAGNAVANACLGQQAIPLAVSANVSVPAGYTINWYASSTSVTPLGNNTWAPPAASSGTFTYYAATRVGNCEFSTRTPVTVSVNTASVPSVAPTVAPTSYNYCQGQTATALAATASSGNTVRWYDAPTGGAFLGTTFIPPTSAAVGMSYYVTQANGIGCEFATRTKVDVNIGAGANIGPTVVSPISICQNSAPTALTATPNSGNTSLVWYGTSATGGTGSATAPVPTTTSTASTTYYVSQKNATGCESLVRSAIVVNITPGPSTPPTTNQTITLCQNATPPLLTATPTTGSGNSIFWYSSGSATGSAIPPVISTNVTTTTTYTFGASQVNAQGCASAQAPITVTVNVTPAPTVSGGLPIVACQNQTITLTSFVSAMNTTHDLIWYNTSATAGTPSSVAPTVSTNTIGTTTYYVSQKNLSNNCESLPRTALAVQVNTLPAAPTVTSPQNFCQNTTASLVAPTGTLRWYTTATGGTATTTTPVVNTTATATASYYVSQVMGVCESARATIASTIVATPTAPTASNLSLCNTSAAQTLTATGTAGATFKWYSGATVLAAAPTITPSNYGTNSTLTYDVSQIISAGSTSCESPKTPIITNIYIAPAPTVTSPVVYCQNANAVPLTAIGGTGANFKWYNAASGGSAIATPTPSTAAAANAMFYVSQTLYANGSFAGCESPRSAINVIINALPYPPQYTTPANYCVGGATYPLSATPETGWTLNWYTVESGGAASSVTPVPNVNLSPGTSYYWVSQTDRNSCESVRKMITLNLNPTPTSPATVLPVAYCQNANAQPLTAIISMTGDVLKWKEEDQDAYPFLATAPTPVTTTAGTKTYWVSETNSFNCESKRKPQVVTIHPTPAKPTTVSPEIYCQNETIRPLSALGDVGSIIKWYGSTLNALNATPTLSTAVVGTTTYYASQVNGFNCESPTSAIQVTVKPLPVAPTPTKSSHSYCQFDANAVPLDATGTALKWYEPGNNVVTTAPTPSTSVGFTGSYFVTSTVDGCEGPKAEIKVEIKTTPIPAFSSPLTLCQNQADVKPLQATGTAVKWYGNKTGGASQANAPTPFVQTPGTYYWYVTQTGSNGCESPRGEFVFVIQPLPSAAISGDASIAQGQSATLKIDFLGQGPWTYTMSNGFSSTTTQNPITITVTPLETEVYTITKVSNICGQGIPAGTATINVKSTTITAGTPNVSTLCAGGKITLPFLTSDGLPVNVQYKLQISKTKDDSDFQSVPTTGNTSPIEATIPTTAKGGNYYFRMIASTPTGDIKGKISDLQLTIRELPSATVSGPPNQVFDNTDHKITFSLTGESPWTLVYKDSLANANQTVTVNLSPFEITSPPKTNTYSVVSVANACGNGTAGSKYRLRVFPLLSVSNKNNGDWLKAYPIPTRDNVLVEIANRKGKTANLAIVDLVGRKIMSQKITEDATEIDLKKLPLGAYILQVELEGNVLRKKIIKSE